MLTTVGVVLVLLAAVLLGRRPQDRRLACLLVLLCVAYAVRGLGASEDPWAFGLGRALGQLAEFVLVWVMLSFPTGRLRSWGDRGPSPAARPDPVGRTAWGWPACVPAWRPAVER
ncbi:hypothetical protein ACIQV3_27285 [Streptomyces sp. NPDC099050]|uniref:hypothetical protein n=1 Tax=Streptomyces sp. NPDC099050 TaxID=3366100 RepID=UPI0037F6FF9D